jgi:hypothetical protein
MPVTATLKIEAELSPGVWTNLADDLVQTLGVTIKYGLDGSGPADCVASPGMLRFALRNDTKCSGAVLGYYSPRHASKRTGWTFGIGVRARITCAAASITDKVKFLGKVYAIEPVPGRDGERYVVVTAYDSIRDLLDAEVRSLSILENSDESTAIDDVLDAVPTSAQPEARSLDTGVNLMPAVFDDLRGGRTALKVIQDLTASAHGKAFVKGDGTFVYKNRHNWGPLNTSQATLTGATASELDAPSSIDALYNRVRVTVHPKTISATADEILHESVVQVLAGETRQIWCDYSDPNDRQTKVGGTSVDTSLTAGTDYNATVDEEGSGASLNANITASLTAFSSTGLYQVANSGTQTAFVRLRIYGKAIRDLAPQTVEDSSTQNWDQVLSLDLPYQSSTDFARGLAEYLEGEWATLTNQLNAVGFWASRDATLMGYALNREPGEEITVSETVTGVSSAGQVIQSVELEIVDNVTIRCRWGLTPASSLSTPWQLGTGALTTTATLGL